MRKFSIIVAFILFCVIITFNVCSIKDLKSKVAEHQILIEELVKYTVYNRSEV